MVVLKVRKRRMKVVEVQREEAAEEVVRSLMVCGSKAAESVVSFLILEV